MSTKRKYVAGEMRGESHPCATLTEDDVRAIRVRVAAGESRTRVAFKMGLSYSAISLIVQRKRWSHVK
jgi:hypothetical protein